MVQCIQRTFLHPNKSNKELRGHRLLTQNLVVLSLICQPTIAVNFTKTPQREMFPKKRKVADIGKGKKVAAPEESPPPRGLKRKNPMVSPSYTPPPFDDDDEAESSLEKGKF